ncbi:MAG: Ig-like domain-containing protein, partial [Prevotellaceae bacterium]|nr:Ig-like domain-containing protein [Prevotellaceae bacterium]
MKKQIFTLFVLAVAASIIALGCANRGSGPQGGPKDIAPPVPVKSSPINSAVNYKKSHIEVIFNEIILVEKAFDNVVVSPPQIKPAVVKAYGRHLVVNLADTLLDNTTYTIDFGQAIVDNNEKNVLSGYSFSFSTGAQIDTLQMSGFLIDASNLNPLPNIFVGIHSDLSDSAFITKAFDRITKTDEKGNFTIRNIKAGKYRIYALEDIGSNFRFDQPNEQIAFLENIFEPIAVTETKYDTLWRDSISKIEDKIDTIRFIDTIKTVQTTQFYPDSIILKAFTEEFHKQYLIKNERPNKYHFSLYFNDMADSLPKIKALNFPFENAVFIQANDRKDSLTYWLTDSLAWNTDTLHLIVEYLKTDSLNQLVRQTDTLHLRLKKSAAQPQNHRKNQKNAPPQQEFLKFQTN